MPTQVKRASRVLWLPFLLIGVSVIIALIETVLLIYYYPRIIASEISGLTVGAFGGFALPLFVLGIALLLLLLTKAQKGTATWSRLLFCVGGVSLIISGILHALSSWGTYLFYNEQPYFTHFWDTFSLYFYGTVCEMIGIAICAISSLLIARAYLNGEISTR